MGLFSTSTVLITSILKALQKTSTFCTMLEVVFVVQAARPFILKIKFGKWKIKIIFSNFWEMDQTPPLPQPPPTSSSLLSQILLLHPNFPLTSPNVISSSPVKCVTKLLASTQTPFPTTASSSWSWHASQWAWRWPYVVTKFATCQCLEWFSLFLKLIVITPTFFKYDGIIYFFQVWIPHLKSFFFNFQEQP